MRVRSGVHMCLCVCVCVAAGLSDGWPAHPRQAAGMTRGEARSSSVVPPCLSGTNGREEEEKYGKSIGGDEGDVQELSQLLPRKYFLEGRTCPLAARVRGTKRSQDNTFDIGFVRL